MIKRAFFFDIEKMLVGREPDEDEPDYRREQRLRLLGEVLDANLTKKQKCYIILYYRENMKISDIAELYGVVPSTVSRTINRARKKLYNIVTGRELYTRYIKPE